MSMSKDDECYPCEPVQKVKGRFGLAWVSETPDCPLVEPVGWQVQFHDTPSQVEHKCQDLVRWINCPPLPRCEPCPPEELCCNQQKKPSFTCEMCKCRAPKEREREKRKKCCCCCCCKCNNGRYRSPKRSM